MSDSAPVYRNNQVIFHKAASELIVAAYDNGVLVIHGWTVSPHYSREMRDQSQTIDIVHNYANGLFDEVFCNEISGPGVWWPGPISGGPMNYSG